MIRVVVGRQELAKQALGSQATRQLVQEGRVAGAAVRQAALEIAPYGERARCARHLVHVDRQAIGMQAETAGPAGAIDIGAGEPHALDAERDELRPHAIQRQRHAAIGDHRPSRRPVLYAAELAPHDDGRLHSALRWQRLEADAAFAQRREAGFTSGDQ